LTQPYHNFDHAPAILKVPLLVKSEPRPVGWNNQFSGFCMFRLVKKLKVLKKPLRKLIYDNGNLHTNVKKLRFELDKVQTDLDANPTNLVLQEEKAVYAIAFNEALIMEERFLKQKAKIEWLSVDGSIASDEGVTTAFISHYENFLGQQGNDKSPGPDGYTAAFFKEAWDIVSYDVISAIQYKVIANKIKESLKMLISPNQSAFVLGRKISDNILLTQKLMHNYHLDREAPRCAFKVDIQKAGESDLFTYHRYCSKTELTNLCFADDMFLFAYGDASSAKVIMEALEEFKLASRLILSLSKSTAYFCNVLNHVKISILNILPFEEGRLSVKYLGVPLVSSRLVYRDCKELLEKVHKRVWDWKNKPLSAAGILQLVQSVIGFMHVFWALVFILSSRILLDIEQQMSGLEKNSPNSSVDPGVHLAVWLDYIYVIWPAEWGTKYPIILLFTVPSLDANARDVLEWRNSMGISRPFSVSLVWNCIRPMHEDVDWCEVVWDVMKLYAGLSNISASLESILTYIVPIAKRKNVQSVVAKLVLVASTYFIWQERWDGFSTALEVTDSLVVSL
nr:reverse transcriptase domain, reverse transcriptase zinc-binding domain protein [Tanacetum cinerariifolium]